LASVSNNSGSYVTIWVDVTNEPSNGTVSDWYFEGIGVMKSNADSKAVALPAYYFAGSPDSIIPMKKD